VSHGDADFLEQKTSSSGHPARQPRRFARACSVRLNWHGNCKTIVMAVSAINAFSDGQAFEKSGWIQVREAAQFA
jgi:hypothetical protein